MKKVTPQYIMNLCDRIYILEDMIRDFDIEPHKKEEYRKKRDEMYEELCEFVEIINQSKE